MTAACARLCPKGGPPTKTFRRGVPCLLATRGCCFPESKHEAYKAPPATLPRSKGHHRDWLDACKGGAPASSNFEYGARLTELLLLGILSLRTGKRIDW